MQNIEGGGRSISAEGEKSSADIKRILVFSKGWFHPSLLVRKRFRDMLLSFSSGGRTGSYEFSFTNRFEDFIRIMEAETLHDSHFDGIILLMHEKKLPAACASEFLTKIQSFLSRGGGLMAVHGALASFKSIPEYGKILGSRFKGHGPPGPVEVIERNESAYFMFTEELYLHDFDLSNNILWYSKYKGEKVPVAWTREENGGRVFCFSLGHYAATFENKMAQKIIYDGLGWITRQVNEL